MNKNILVKLLTNDFLSSSNWQSGISVELPIDLALKLSAEHKVQLLGDIPIETDLNESAGEVKKGGRKKKNEFNQS